MTDSKPAALPRLVIATDGGFAGRGMGGIVVEDNAVTASELARTCNGELTGRERDGLVRSVATFEPSTNAAAHPDQIGYKLTVGSVVAQWHGEEAPASAGALFKALWKIRERVLDECR